MSIGIYLVGASGTGKTTLGRHVEAKYGVPRIKSAARETLKAFGLREDQFSQLMADQDRYEEYQKQVFATQLLFEENAAAKGHFVSERAFDHLVFRALYGRGSAQMYASPDMKDYFHKLAGAYTDFTPVVFLVRPSREAFEAAQKDGDRQAYINWEDIHRFDGAMEFLLEVHGVKYMPLGAASVRSRVKVVNCLLEAAGLEPVG